MMYKKKIFFSFESQDHTIFLPIVYIYNIHVYLLLCDVTVDRLELSDFEHFHMGINYLFFCQIKTNFG